jgi:hypothetical protein
LAELGVARADAFAVIELTVTSPPIRESPETVTVPLADVPDVVTLDETDDA